MAFFWWIFSLKKVWKKRLPSFYARFKRSFLCIVIFEVILTLSYRGVTIHFIWLTIQFIVHICSFRTIGFDRIHWFLLLLRKSVFSLIVFHNSDPLSAAGWRWLSSLQVCLMFPADKAGSTRGVGLPVSLVITPVFVHQKFCFDVCGCLYPTKRGHDHGTRCGMLLFADSWVNRSIGFIFRVNVHFPVI